MKALIIYNSLKKENYFLVHLYKIITYLSYENYNVIVRATTSKDDLSNTCKENIDTDLLIVSGGDGTMYQSINAYNKFKMKCKILYLPSGTVNDFAFSLNLLPNVEFGLKLLKQKSLLTIDSAKINQQYFNYVCAFGVFSKSSFSVSHEQKKLLGPFSYILNALSSLNEMSESYAMKIIIDDVEVIEDSFTLGLISNSSSVGGFRNLFNHNDLNDGMFEMLFVSSSNKDIIKDLANLYKIRQGKLNVNSKKFIYRKIKKLSIICNDSVKWSLDGESGPCGKVEIEVLENNYEIYAKKGDS